MSQDRLVGGSAMTLVDRNIVVTGAARGVGRAIVDMALALGARIAAVDIDPDALDELCASAPDRVFPFAADVVDEAAAMRCVAQVVDAWGQVDGLVNNAGVLRSAMIDKMTMEQWRTVIDVHLTGNFIWTQAVGRQMIERYKRGERGGAIVNISSDAGRTGTVGQINYAAAKSGVLGMTMAVAREWARFGIRCNSVAFGVIETAMTETIRGDRFGPATLERIPMGRWGRVDEAAQPVCFLLSDAASYITGQHIAANGGMFIGLA